MPGVGPRQGVQDDDGQATAGDGVDGQPQTKVSDLPAELGINRETLYRHVDPDGMILPYGRKLLRVKGT